MSTADISWLTRHHVGSLVKEEFTWKFVFSDGVILRVECPWRLLEAGRIIVTSEDHGQKFGLPAPVDSVLEVNRRISGTGIASADIREGTLDIYIAFTNDHTLEVLPISCGYEAWQLGHCDTLMIATGGGRLVLFSQKPNANSN